MTGRLIWAILSSIIEEAAIVAVVLWGLPELGVFLPIPGLVVLMVLWAAFSVFLYQAGTRALKKKAFPGLPDMVGYNGIVIKTLDPLGTIKIHAELWYAKAPHKQVIKVGEKVVVTGQDSLVLTVKKQSG